MAFIHAYRRPCSWNCVGGIDFECSEGWDKRACASPDAGYMLVGSNAIACPSTKMGSLLVTVAAFFTLIAFWVIVNVFAIGQYDSLDMMLNSFQVR